MEQKFIKSVTTKRFNKAKDLIAKSTNIHLNKDSSFRRTIFYGHVNIAEYLLEKGADLNTWEDWGIRLCGHIGN